MELRTLLDIHSGDGRAELSFYGIILFIRKACSHPSTAHKHPSPITAAQFQARNSPLHLCTATEVRGHGGQTKNRTYKKLPQVQREACLVFLLPIPVFSTGVAESHRDHAVAENAECPAATSLISKSSLLLLSKFSSFFL